MTHYLLQVSLETAQLEVDIGRSIFQANCEKFGQILTEYLLKHVLTFVQEHNIILVAKVTNFTTPQRKKNVLRDIHKQNWPR